ncbi:Meiotic sister chromatid recombination protein 1 [Candida viswanathii]|uniref:Meiotic sister chromatid recombination protein 1 n=1 Tax=Candida viswanathii TaxID=5486 RepID=A0A367YJT7_9ASCO|nr:Meiotic sister chromatid recombination protein 1 [Candida viswanathii]
MMVSIVLWLYLLVLPVLANYGFDQWSNSDIKQFLKERKVSFNDKLDNPKLISLANEEAKKLEKEYQKFIKKKNVHDSSEFLNFNYLFGNKDNDKYSVKEWIFESWPVTNLQNLLSSNGISFKKDDTRQDLIEKIKKDFDRIAKEHQGSKFYPGNWLYESSWSDEDLKKWLGDYGIDFEPRSTRDDLIDKLKEFSYQATNSIKDTKESLFNSLDLFDKSIFDKYGQIKDEFFETWNYSQLREWLYLHGFIDTKPGIYVEELSKDELIKIAQTYKKYLLGDIQTWLADTEKDYQPWITKGEQKKKNKVDDWINDTFFVGINNWSKDKLREFLDVRKVPYSIFTTKHQLIELVRQHKFDPIYTETFAWVVDDVSTDSIKQWLKDQGQQIEGSRLDLVSAFQKQFEGLRKGASNFYNNIELQIRFYTPDINGYRQYLAKNLDPKEYEKLTEDEIQKGFELVQEYYNLGSEAAKENFDKAKFSAADALDQIEEASYAYSLEFLHDVEKGKNNIASFITDAQTASRKYVESLTHKLSQNIDELQSGVWDRLTNWWYGAQTAFDNRVSAANQVVLDVHDEVNTYHEQVGEKYESLKAEAAKKGLSIAGDAKQNYESIESQISEQYDEAAADVRAKYDQAQEQVSKLASDVNSRASDAQEDFDKGYIRYKTVIGDYANNIYRKALYGLSYFNSKVYDTAKTTEKEINSKWDDVVKAFSNADLKAYLRSFGYNYDWLSRLNRRELVNLAAFQNKLFTGYNNVKNWERSVGDVLNDASEDLQVKLGLKSKPQGFFAKLRSYVGL